MYNKKYEYKKKKEVTCKTGLKKNIIDKEVYEREIQLCKQLSRKGNGGCGWGKCKDCGVPLILEKLHKGVLVEDKDGIKKVKDKIIKGD